MTDPLTDPRVAAARARVKQVDRVPERYAEPTAEASAGTSAASMRIYGRIDSDGAPWGISAADVATALDSLPDATQRLDVHVHSRGGDAFEGLAILNLLRQAKPEVHVTVDGLAASAASAIAMAGRTITMAPSSQLMIHDASGIGIGQAADLRVLADALDSVSESYAAAYAARAGGEPADWRAAMVPESWYRAEEAVKAGLADAVAGSAAAPEASLDLSIFAYAGRDAAPEPFIPTTQAPAEPPVVPSIETEEVGMSDTLIQGLRERFDLADDADEATVLAKADELLEQATKPEAVTDDAIAQARNLTAEQVKAALEAAVKGHTSVSPAKLAELEAMAREGAEARGKQREQERDETIAKAFSDGKISADRRDAWKAAWDKDPEGTAKDLADLPARFPAAQASGYAGGDDTSADEQLFNTFFPQSQEA